MADEVREMLRKQQEEWNTTHAAEKQKEKQIKKIKSEIQEITKHLANLSEAIAQYKAKDANEKSIEKQIDDLTSNLKSLQDELKSLHAKKGGARRTRRTRRTRTRRSRRQ